MMYRAESKIKGVNNKQITNSIREFVLHNSPEKPIIPDVWINSCRDFATKNGYEVTFFIDRIYTFNDGQLTADNAIISTFKLIK